jgi:hypothetical protein
MAVERTKKELAIDLKDIVLFNIDTFKSLRKDIQIKLESDFAQRVIDEDLDYREQLRVRQEMVRSEKRKVFPDSSYINEIKKAMSDTRKLTKFQIVREDYLEAWTDYKTGTNSIDSYIFSLENQMSNINDPILRAELREELSNARITRRNVDTVVVENKVSLAKEDGSYEVLNNMISELKILRAKESATGNKDRVSAIDTQVTSLRKQLNQAKIQDINLDMEFNIYKSGGSSKSKLKILSDVINSADAATPITINNTRYESSKQYWEFIRNSYLSGEGTGIFSDIWEELSSEIEDKLTAVSNSTLGIFGEIPVADIERIMDIYSELESKSYMAPFMDLLNNQRSKDVNEAVKASADAIILEASGKLNWEGVELKLKSLEDSFDIDLSAYRNKAQLDFYSKQTAFLSNINSLAEIKVKERWIREGKNPSDLSDPAVRRMFDIEVQKEKILFAKETSMIGAEPRVLEGIGEKPPEEVEPPTEKVEPLPDPSIGKMPTKPSTKPVVTPPASTQPVVTTPASTKPSVQPGITSKSSIEDIEKFLETKPGAPIIFKGDKTQYIRTIGTDKRFNVLRGLRTPEELARATKEKTVRAGAGAVELPMESKKLFKEESPFFKI